MGKKQSNTVAVRRKDPSRPSSTIVDYVPAPPSKSTRCVRECIVCHKPMSFSGTAPTEVRCSQCLEKDFKEAQRLKRAEEASRINRVCVTCGAPFYIKAAKAAELNAAGLELFTHCYVCQKKREAARAAQ